MLEAPGPPRPLEETDADLQAGVFHYSSRFGRLGGVSLSRTFRATTVTAPRHGPVGWHPQGEPQPHGVYSNASQLTAGGRHCGASSARLCVLESATVGLPDIILECDPEAVPVAGGDTAAAAYGSAAPTARLRHSRWWRVAPSTWRLGPPADDAASRDPLEGLRQRDRVRAFFAVASECSRTGGVLVVKLRDTDPALTACWEMAGFAEAVEAWLSAAAEGEARWRWMLPRAPRPPGAPVGEISAGSAEQGVLF